MLLVTLVDKCGTGLWTSAVALYFTQVSGLSLGLVGLLVGVSGGIGIAGAPLAGRLADRFPVTRVLVAAQLLRALALLALLTTREFALLLLYSAVGALPDRASSVLTKIYAARLTGPERVRYQAVIRTVANVGWAVGGLAAAVALGFSTSLAYRLLLVGNAASYLVIAVLTTRCAEPPAPSQPPRLPAPATPPVASPASAAPAAPAPEAGPAPERSPWRDRLFLLYTLTETVLFLDDAILQVAMPLWILHATGAPLGLAPLLMVINNLVVVACQVPLSRFGATPSAARRLLRPLAAVFLVGCLALSASALVGPALAVVALVVATLGLTGAEMLHAVLSWELSVALSPPAAQGAYLGVHGLATSVQRSAGPLALTGVVAAGPVAWPLVGVVLIATCWAQNTLVRRRLGADPDAAAPPLVAAGG